jgi:hypothetical protein
MEQNTGIEENRYLSVVKQHFRKLLHRNSFSQHEEHQKHRKSEIADFQGHFR